MKTTTKILFASIALAVPSAAFAEPGEGKKGDRADRPSKEEILAEFDADGDGKLSPEERVPMLKKRAEKDQRFADKLLKKHDADKDGTMSDAEYLAAAKAMKKGGKKGAKKDRTAE